MRLTKIAHRFFFGAYVVQDLGGGIHNMLHSESDSVQMGWNDGNHEGEIEDRLWKRIDMNKQETAIGISSVSKYKTEHTVMFFSDKSYYPIDLVRTQRKFVSKRDSPVSRDSLIGRQLAVIDQGTDVRFE